MYFSCSILKMNKNLILRLELLWILITLIVLVVVLLPIYSTADFYPFYKYNILFVVVFISLTRYIFFLKHTVLAHRMYLKAVVGFICIPFTFYLIKGLQEFQVYYDEIGLQEFYTSLDYAKQKMMMKYNKAEFFLFGTGSIITAILFPMRMILSIWRNYNKGTV